MSSQDRNKMDIEKIVEKVRSGDTRTVARLIRDIDDGIPSVKEILKALYPYTGNAHVIGITGFPGVGKSTLVDHLTHLLRKEGKTVGILAVDPTSPFSGGAILGDRIRMQRHSLDEGVFIRSLATRGHFGGLTASTRSIVDVMDAMGKDYIILETVGVGQDEVEVAGTAHTTIITLIPGMGDDVQAIKAGILEVGDIFVINKADREGADKTKKELEVMLEMEKRDSDDWYPHIYLTEAINDKGLKELLEGIKEHRAFLSKDGGRLLEEQMRNQLETELLDMIRLEATRAIMRRLEESGDLKRYIDEVTSKKRDPYSVCQEVIGRFIKE